MTPPETSPRAERKCGELNEIRWKYSGPGPTERPRPGKPPVLQEKGQARVIAEACSPAPGGREHWTMQLLADRVVELGLAQACSEDTVRRVLKKTLLSPGSNSSGVFRR